MLITFKEGQKRFEADIEDSPVRLWIAGVLDDYTSNAESTNPNIKTNIVTREGKNNE